MKEIIGLNILGLIINNIVPFKGFFKKFNNREVGMIISIISLYLVLSLLIKYNNNNMEFQERIEIFSYNFGLDGISLALIALISIIEPIIILLVKGESETKEERKRIINNLLILKILIVMLFASLDLLMFFIFFELILIPMFIFISRYGSKYKFFLPRLEAGLRFFLYTMIGSLLMLITIIIFYIKFGTTNNELLLYKISETIVEGCCLNHSSNILLLQILWIFLFFSFLIKIPMFPLHTWLPLAHSDAPTIGSIILAALLLKLGSFGILRYSLYIFTPLNFSLYTDNFNLSSSSTNLYDIFLPYIYILAILSIYYASILTIRGLFDLKKIIAYSSIVHMNFSIFGFFSKDFLGLFGSSFLIFSHAFISSALFLLVGLLYKRYHSRFLFYFQGLSHSLPLFSSFFLIFSFANISLPFFSSFISEFFILFASFHSNPFISLLLLFSLILSSSFIMWFSIRLLFGYPSPYLFFFSDKFLSKNQNLNSDFIFSGFKDLSFNEFFSLSPLLFFTFFFTFFPYSFISLFSCPLSLLI